MDNNVASNQPQEPKKNFLVLFLIVLALVAAVELFLLLQKNGKFPSAVSTNVEETSLARDELEGVAEGAFNVSAGDKSTYTVGVPFTVILSADSNGRGVVGFDAVFQYDTTAFTVGSVSSPVVGFSATSNTSKGYLDVTSTKDSEKIVTPVLKNTDVLVLTFTPKKKGSFSIRLLDKINNSSTKYIDDNTKIFLPKTGSVTVTVE